VGHLALPFLALCAGLSAEVKPEVVRFQTEVRSGEHFRARIGHGLELGLDPTGDGWTIRVSPITVAEPGCEDFSWVINPPFRAYNDLYLNPSYGMTAQDAVERSPREFKFVLNCAACKREDTFVRRLIESSPIGMARSQKQVDEAYAKLGTSPHGEGKLWVLRYKLSRAPEDIDGKNYGRIDWILFRVEIRFPANADSLVTPTDYARAIHRR
jgi:hypothetical protein